MWCLRTLAPCKVHRNEWCYIQDVQKRKFALGMHRVYLRKKRWKRTPWADSNNDEKCRGRERREGLNDDDTLKNDWTDDEYGESYWW